MRLALAVIVVIVATLSAGCNSLSNLENQLLEKERELHELNLLLNASTGSDLATTSDLHADIKLRPISGWLQDATSPKYRISAVGVRHNGDLVYKPGTGKAWIEPERDTKLNFDISTMQIVEGASRLNISTMISGNGVTRIKLRAGPIDTNVLCNLNLLSTVLRAELALGSMDVSNVSYVLRIIDPPSLRVEGNCDLNVLGKPHFAMNINSAVELSKGSFPIGFRKDGFVAIGQNEKRYRYSLASKEPRLRIEQDRLRYETNVEVTLKP